MSAEGRHQGIKKVYLVEVSDNLSESWCPFAVYMHQETAEDCAKTYSQEDVCGIRQFARVVEMMVVDALGRESYGEDAEQDKCAEPGERESYATLKTENEQLRKLISDMWTFAQLVDISGRLYGGGVWNAAEFEKRMRELGVIE